MSLNKAKAYLESFRKDYNLQLENRIPNPIDLRDLTDLFRAVDAMLQHLLEIEEGCKQLLQSKQTK